MAAINCSRCSKSGEPMDKAPFRGPLGQRIHEMVCAACWADWQGMQTRIINENRLSMGDPHAQQMLDDQMKKFLNLGE